MSKDSQIDPKEIRKEKSKGGPTIADEIYDNEGRNQKKLSVNKDDYQSNK